MIAINTNYYIEIIIIIIEIEIVIKNRNLLIEIYYIEIDLRYM